MTWNLLINLSKFLIISPANMKFMIGDLNMTIENFHLNTLLQLFNLNALINSPTCYQSHILTCIDHILTNQKSLFNKFSKTFETGLFDHHKLILTTMKCIVLKIHQKKKRFIDVIKTLALQISETFLKGDFEGVNDDSYRSFENIFLNYLNIKYKHSNIKENC